MRIYFVRHGESEANIIRQISNRGYVHGLTEKGRQQAAALAETLRGNGVSFVYTSPLKRAVETAQILSAGLEVPYEVTGALREFDCGIAEGHPEAWAWDLWRWVWDEWHVHGRLDSRIEDGESLLDLLDRFVPFVDALVAEKKETAGNLVLIGHGGLYAAVLPRVLVLLPGTAIPPINFPNTGYVLAEARPRGLVCLEWCGEKLLDD